ncbi:hypothetical protein EDB86DRAFT_2965172 [Lactarius hatsudake]|nr:hypothetical protein EDB86DRAFT_2965172 [Lactarius hatsudake]
MPGLLKGVLPLFSTQHSFKIGKKPGMCPVIVDISKPPSGPLTGFNTYVALSRSRGTPSDCSGILIHSFYCSSHLPSLQIGRIWRILRSSVTTYTGAFALAKRSRIARLNNSLTGFEKANGERTGRRAYRYCMRRLLVCSFAAACLHMRCPSLLVMGKRTFPFRLYNWLIPQCSSSAIPGTAQMHETSKVTVDKVNALFIKDL